MADEFDIKTKCLAKHKSPTYRGDRLEKILALMSFSTLKLPSGRGYKKLWPPESHPAPGGAPDRGLYQLASRFDLVIEGGFQLTLMPLGQAGSLGEVVCHKFQVLWVFQLVP